jgi:hypothetical protein
LRSEEVSLPATFKNAIISSLMGLHVRVKLVQYTWLL